MDNSNCIDFPSLTISTIQYNYIFIDVDTNSQEGQEVIKSFDNVDQAMYEHIPLKYLEGKPILYLRFNEKSKFFKIKDDKPIAISSEDLVNINEHKTVKIKPLVTLIDYYHNRKRYLSAVITDAVIGY